MNDSSPAKKIVCFGPPKEAALYFDAVFPVDLLTPSFLNQPGLDFDETEKTKILSEYLPHILDKNLLPALENLVGSNKDAVREYLIQTLVCTKLYFVIMAHEARKEGVDTQIWRDLALNDTDLVDPALMASVRESFDVGTLPANLFPLFNDALSRTLINAGFADVPSWTVPDSFSIFGMPKIPTVKEDLFQASLSGLRLIDPSKAAWEHVIEFRKDSASRNALRDLRLFFSSNYNGRDQAYIEDDLLARVERYDKTTRIWGFETVNRSVGVIFSKESVLTTSIGGISATLFGAPLGVAAGAALAMMIGTVGVEVGRSVIERKKAELNNPTRYLTQLRDSFR